MPACLPRLSEGTSTIPRRARLPFESLPSRTQVRPSNCLALLPIVCSTRWDVVFYGVRSQMIAYADKYIKAASCCPLAPDLVHDGRVADPDEDMVPPKRLVQ